MTLQHPPDGQNGPDALVRAMEEVRAQKAEMRTALAKIAEAKTWLQMAEQLGRIGHWRISLPDETITWSSACYRILGVTSDRYTTSMDALIQLFHPQDRAALKAALASAASQGTAFELQARVVQPGGDARCIDMRALTRSGADGKPALIFGVFADITDQRKMETALLEANERLARLAHTDPLTGLANRRHFDETLEREWRRSQRGPAPLSLVVLDIDHFKAFNDRYGHLAGDECLRRVAQAVAQAGRRPGDLAARHGGEEMAMILPDTGAEGARMVAQAIRSAIAALKIPHAANPGIGVVTASLGVATACVREGHGFASWTELFEEADRMLYEAKRSGRNRVATRASLGDARPGAANKGPDEVPRLGALRAYERAGASRRSPALDRIAHMAPAIW